jgi:predicted metal-dependent peptidase
MNLPHVKLTGEQRQAWQDTMSLMAWTAPGFRHLWYRLLQNHDGEYTAQMSPFKYSDCTGYEGDDRPGVAFTDGENIVCNPDEFFKYTLKERVFIGAHEVAHCVYDDPGLLRRLQHETNITTTDGKTFPYKPAVMQQAMDYRINAMLVESRIGHMPKDALYDPEIAKGKDGVFDIYGKVYKQDQDGGPSNPGQTPGHGNAQGKNGFDPNGVQPPGTSTNTPAGQAAAQRNNQQWGLELAQAARLESARSQGKTPGSLQHMFDSILDPVVPWTDHIETIAKRLMGTGSYDWRRADRRFIGRDLYLPGRSGSGAGWLVIWGDTSGSIGEKDLNRYLGELKGMIEEVKPSRLSVVWCDAEIRHIDEVTDTSDLEHIKARGVGGRGGTDVTPVFDWIAEQREEPEMFIGMTDGYVGFPDKPPYPIVWASISEDVKYPYGDVVNIIPRKSEA